MDQHQIEDIFQKTFAGLSLFYRDCDLDQALIDRYAVGQIIQEKGFTDATYKGGGLTANLRYLIASAHAKDVASLVPQMEEFGLVMLNDKAFFKVIDIQNQEGKTQITLLHIAEDTVDFFQEHSSNVEEQIATRARDNFSQHILSAPVLCLQKQEWKDRTASPLGMSDAGVFFKS